MAAIERTLKKTTTEKGSMCTWFCRQKPSFLLTGEAIRITIFPKERNTNSRSPAKEASLSLAFNRRVGFRALWLDLSLAASSVPTSSPFYVLCTGVKYWYIRKQFQSNHGGCESLLPTRESRNRSFGRVTEKRKTHWWAVASSAFGSSIRCFGGHELEIVYIT